MKVRAKQLNIDADLPANSHKITGLADPTGAQDAATKNYVDGVATGLSWKQAVRAATTANGTLSSAFANGSVIDGVTLATNDRVLLKNQSTGSQNGIYTVNASGAPTRSLDADSAPELLGACVFVEEGTANAGKQFVQTAISITLGTTSLVFTQFGALPSIPVPTTNSGTASTTASDGDTTGVTISATPSGVPSVFVNGLRIILGNADKTHDCYFSADGGTTAKASNAVASGDTLYWVGSVAGYQLDSSDMIAFMYNV